MIFKSLCIVLPLSLLAGQIFAFPKHTQEPSVSIDKVLFCNSDEEEGGFCLESKHAKGQSVSYFEAIGGESKKAKTVKFSMCSATTGGPIEGHSGGEGFYGTTLENEKCKVVKDGMIAVVGLKDPKIEALYFSRIEKTADKKEVEKLLTKQSWYSELIKENPSYSDVKKLKILNLNYQNINFYVITAESSESSTIIFGNKDSLEVVNGIGAGGVLEAAFLVNTKPIVLIRTCAKNTCGCVDYTFELTK